MVASPWGDKYPLCIECKSTVRKHQARNLCTKCYPQKILKETCSICNKVNVVSRRINQKAICGFCNRKQFCPPQKRACSICKKLGRIDLIKEEKDICTNCNKKYFYIQPTQICTGCEEKKKVEAYTEGKPYCNSCYGMNFYKKPKHICNRCERYRKTNEIIEGKRICDGCYKKEHKFRFWLYNQPRRKHELIDIDEQIIKKIIKRDEKCVYCKKIERLSIDHVIPISKGGKTEENNLVLACRNCNSSKNNSEVIKWCKRKGIEVPMIIKELLANP